MNTIKIVIAWIAFILLLSSCSETNYDQSTTSSPSEAIPLADSLDNSSSDRKIIKTAEIKIQVDKVPDKIKEIQSAVNATNGHVIHFEIQSNQSFLKEVAYNLDSSYAIYSAHPEGIMKVKIPKQNADTFIHTMLTLHAEIDQLMIDEQDITEEITENKQMIQASFQRAEASNLF